MKNKRKEDKKGINEENCEKRELSRKKREERGKKEMNKKKGNKSRMKKQKGKGKEKSEKWRKLEYIMSIFAFLPNFALRFLLKIIYDSVIVSISFLYIIYQYQYYLNVLSISNVMLYISCHSRCVWGGPKGSLFNSYYTKV